MVSDIFEELKVSGNVGMYGREEQGFTIALFHELRKHLPEISFIGEPTPNILQLAQITKDEFEMKRIRSLATRAISVVSDTRQFLASHRIEKNHLVTKSGVPLTIGDVQRHIRLWSAERDLENAEGMILSNGRDAGVCLLYTSDAADE